MQTNSPLRRDVTPADGAPAPVGSDELAEGLMLVRESTLKIIRFQLAMERHDRRVALAAVDDLVALDRRLRDYLGDVPAPELESERAALNREKLALAAQVIRPEPKPVETVAAPVEIGPPAPEAWEQFEYEEEDRHRAVWWLAAVLLLLSAAAAAAYWISGPGALTAFAGLIP
jgi:hypothetical protein